MTHPGTESKCHRHIVGRQTASQLHQSAEHQGALAARPACLPLTLTVDEKHRSDPRTNHGFRDGAEERMLETRGAVRRHDDHVSVVHTRSIYGHVRPARRQYAPRYGSVSGCDENRLSSRNIGSGGSITIGISSSPPWAPSLSAPFAFFTHSDWAPSIDTR
jgi:hypothetical protein